MTYPHDDLILWQAILAIMGAYGWRCDHRPLFAKSGGNVLYDDQFPLGAVIATAELIECYEIEKTWRNRVRW